MEDKIRDAYERMTPTPEQEQRMLAALQKAQEEKTYEAMMFEAAASVKDGAASDGAASSPAPVQQPAQSEVSSVAQGKRSRFSAWKVVAPIAACLVVGAIALGVGALGQAPNNSSLLESKASSDVSASTQAEAELSYYADEGDAVAIGDAEDGLAFSPSELYDYGQFNTEEYAAVKENGFVSTRANPLSTVSADVDTASYANLRRMLASGYSLNEIPSGAVRVEEMLNYFTYDYERPTDGDLFKVQAQVSACPWNQDTQLLVLGFATPHEATAAQNGANLVFLIDVSGSMGSSDKLSLLQDSFATLLEHLDANDRVSIVTYSGKEQIVLEGVPGDDDVQILKAVYKLQAGGSTNGEAGMRMAYEVAQRNFIEGGVNRIIMASDGDMNVGMTSESELFDFVSGQRETGIYLSVLGFGSGNYKDTKMETLADNGNGSYHYIDCIDEAERVFSDRLMANLVPFADDVKVQVEFNPDQVKGYRLIGYENRALSDEQFLDDSVDAGDVGPEAQFTVAYEIALADSPLEIPVPDLKYGDHASTSVASTDWLTCSLRYRAFSDGEVHAQDLAVDAGDVTVKPSDDWKFAAAVIEFGMIANNSAYKGTATVDSVTQLLESMQLNDERAGFFGLVNGERDDT